MALKGTLKDFSVADMFQLIGQQAKSGSLYVRSKDKEARIVFDVGKVVLATFKKSDEEFLLGTMLLRAAVITGDQLAKAIENQKTTMRSLGDILKSMGAVTPGVLSEFVNLQLREILFRLFQWKEGFYEFIPEKVQYNRAIIKPQSAEAVLMDGFRMLDEWPAISEKVTSTEGVYKALVDPSEIDAAAEEPKVDDALDDAFSGMDDDDSPPPEKHEKSGSTYSKDHKNILGLLNGNRSVQEVIYLSRLGTFETCKIIRDLLDREAVEKISELSPTRVDLTRSFRPSQSLGGWFISSIKTLMFVFTISAAIPVVAFGVRSHWSLRYTDTKRGVPFGSAFTLRELRSAQERSGIQNALSVYFLENGSYPAALDDAIAPDIAKRWEYIHQAKHYTLKLRDQNHE